MCCVFIVFALQQQTILPQNPRAECKQESLSILTPHYYRQTHLGREEPIQSCFTASERGRGYVSSSHNRESLQKTSEERVHTADQCENYTKETFPLLKKKSFPELTLRWEWSAAFNNRAKRSKKGYLLWNGTNGGKGANCKRGIVH